MMLREKTSRGIIWNFSEQIIRRGSQVAFTLILASILTPKDFGLVAMMAVFLAIANSLMESGFKQAVIQRKAPNQTDLDTAFYTNFALSILAYALLWLSAPLIASLYSEPRLVLLIRAAGTTIVFNSFRVVPLALLSRRLDFRSQLAATVPATFLSGILSVWAAYMGAGVWALLVQMISSSILTSLFLWAMNLWRPTGHFSYRSFSEMFGFGSRLFLAGILNVGFQNLYVAVIAKVFSAELAGLYFLADRIRDLIVSQLVTSVRSVIFPAMSKLQSANDRLVRASRHIVQATTFTIFPLIVLLGAFAYPIFEAALSTTWLPSAFILQLMCISALSRPLHGINLELIKSKGRSDIILKLEIIKKLMIVGAITIGIQFGITGILVGQIISSWAGHLANSYYSGKVTSYTPGRQFYDFAPNLILSVLVGVGVLKIHNTVEWAPALEIFVFGGLAILIYTVLAYWLRLPGCLLVWNMLKMSTLGRRLFPRAGV